MSLKRNLDQLVYDQIQERIIRGEWALGANLEIDELAEEYEVSRTPVLQALKRMANEGQLVVSRVGKFYFPEYSCEQVEDICRVRSVLEQEALREIQKKKQDMDWQKLHELAVRCKLSNERGDTIASRLLDMQWHQGLVSAAENECLSGIYHKVQGQYMVASYLSVDLGSDQQAIVADDHVQVMDLLEQGEYDEAVTQLDGHIYRACGQLLSGIRAARNEEN